MRGEAVLGHYFCFNPQTLKNMENSIYEQYALVASQVKELQIKQKLLSLQCLAEMESNNANQMKADFGTFSTVERKKWTYTNIVKELEKSVKEQKKEEEENGEAKFETSKSLRFQVTK